MTQDVLAPDSDAALADLLKAGAPVEIVGAGTKLGLGRPVTAPRRLDMRGFQGITLYEPAELVMSVRAGTPLAEIDIALAMHRQCLAFEPPDLSRLLGIENGHQTIGGVIATNLSGPRRCVAGAARDHMLGLKAVNGRGEMFKAGGRVVKNVTGYDLPKLLTGSYGTMAVLTEVTLKVLPAAETEQTLAIMDLPAEAAVAVMGAGLGSPAAISGAAWLPDKAGGSVTGLRLEGIEASVTARREALQNLLRGKGDFVVWPDEMSRQWWRNVRDVTPLVGAADRALWKIALPAPQAPTVLARLKAIPDLRAFLDWGGGLLWVSLPCGEDAQAARLRAALPEDGYAMLMRAPDRIRLREAVFQPRPAAQAALEERIRLSFDPDRRLNPGRMSQTV